MNKLFFSTYIVIFVAISIISIFNDIDKVDEGYPLWMAICGVMVPIFGIIVMVFYILEKPHKLTSFWKVAPIVMVFYYALEWYYDCIVYRGIDDTNVLIGVTIVLVILLLYPLFFVSFKYGYSSDFMKTGGQSQSCSARDLLSDKPN